MKVLPFPCKRPSLGVPRMTTLNGVPVSSTRLKDSVVKEHFQAKYSDTQINYYN